MLCQNLTIKIRKKRNLLVTMARALLLKKIIRQTVTSGLEMYVVALGVNVPEFKLICN